MTTEENLRSRSCSVFPENNKKPTERTSEHS